MAVTWSCAWVNADLHLSRFRCLLKAAAEARTRIFVFYMHDMKARIAMVLEGACLAHQSTALIHAP